MSQRNAAHDKQLKTDLVKILGLTEADAAATVAAATPDAVAHLALDDAPDKVAALAVQADEIKAKWKDRLSQFRDNHPTKSDPPAAPKKSGAAAAR